MKKPESFDELIDAVKTSGHMAAIQISTEKTQAEKTKAAIIAAFTTAVIHGMITITNPEYWPIFLEPQPEFTEE